MPVSKSILGLNARNFRYIKRFNRRRHKALADNKLATKELLLEHDIPTAGLIAKFTSFDDARHVDWHALPKDFVLKPARGYGGRGILIVRNWNGTEGKTSRGEIVNRTRIESEIFSILDGAYSLSNLPDEAFIEHRVKLHPFFKRLGVTGVPDIRLIVWKKVPIMAMLRIPTIFSDGKANLHLGALGVGIDIGTGITTGGILYDQLAMRIPGKKTKVRGLKMPYWEEILRIAARAQDAAKLGYVGVDIVLDRERGPLVLELNVRPGLSIQIANQASLRTRLERIEDMKIPSVERGVELAKTLFGDEDLKGLNMPQNVLGAVEEIMVYGVGKKRKKIFAKIDTGAYRTSIDEGLMRELGLVPHDRVVGVRAGLGREVRSTVELSFRLRGKKTATVATFRNRTHMSYPMIIGRKDIQGYLVDPAVFPEDGDGIEDSLLRKVAPESLEHGNGSV